MRIVQITVAIAAASLFAIIVRSVPRGGDDAPADRPAVRAGDSPRQRLPATTAARAIPAARGEPLQIAPPPSASDSAPRPRPEPSSGESADQLRASVEDRFQADAIDRDWSVAARRQAETHLTSSLPAGSRLRSLECRGSICRAEVEHADLTAHQAFLRSAITYGAGWDGPAMAAIAPNSGGAAVLTVVYLGRTPSSLTDVVPVEALDMPNGDERSH